MNHCSDDDLVLHYYGESREADRHVAECAACADRARELAALLGAMTSDVPERHELYGAEVWYRVRPHLEPRRSLLATWRWPLATAATVVLLASGFLAGRLSMPASSTTTRTPVSTADADQQVGHRVLLLSVADHLERSERVLTDIMNTGRSDISAEQQWAGDLIAANRLYRQHALAADESSVATVLDELERALLDIVHGPADAHADLDEIRQRIDSAALLFKVRVMGDELRQREFRSDDSSPRRSSIPVS